MQIKDFPTQNYSPGDWLLLQQSQESEAYYKIPASALNTNSNNGGGLAPWQAVTQDKTALKGDRLLVTSPNVKITLPANNQIGDEISICPGISNFASCQILLQNKKFLGQQIPLYLKPKRLQSSNFIWSGEDFGWVDGNDVAIEQKTYRQIILDSNPYAYYRLGETSGTQAIDSSVNNRHGTYLNATLGQNSFFADENKCVSLASNGMIYLPTSMPSPTTYSLEGWFKTTSLSGSLFGFSSAQQSGGSNFDRELFLSNGKLKYYVYAGADLLTNPTFNDNQWHCFTVTASPSGGVSLWVDKVLQASSSNGNGQAYTGYWHIGYSVRGGYFNGLLDEMSINSSVVTNIPDRHEAR
jgi:hypothetical protein